jgi:hypothetical protein
MMRLGCVGCVTLLATMTVAVVMALAGGWAVARALDDPGLSAPPFSKGDSATAQHKLFDIARRARPKPGGEPVVLSEAEINAFLAVNLDGSRLGLRSPFVRLLGDDALEFAGVLPLGRVLRESSLSRVADALPERWLGHPVWARGRARARLETAGRRYLRLDVEAFSLGRQRLPATLARLVLDPASLRWFTIPLPEGVGAVSVERGRVVIRSAS